MYALRCCKFKCLDSGEASQIFSGGFCTDVFKYSLGLNPDWEVNFVEMKVVDDDTEEVGRVG